MAISRWKTKQDDSFRYFSSFRYHCVYAQTVRAVKELMSEAATSNEATPILFSACRRASAAAGGLSEKAGTLETLSTWIERFFCSFGVFWN